MSTARNEELWMKAKRRAGFKKHLATYVLVNIMMWVIWAFTAGEKWINDIGGLPWPAYSTIFWGIGVVMNYLNVFVFYRNSLAEKEYLKLLKEEEKNNPEPEA